jgi:hypothetical protein
MGLFDTIHFKCPGCGERFEEQTKVGACTLAYYDADVAVPPDIAVCYIGSSVECYHCNKTWRIAGERPKSVRLTLIPGHEDTSDDACPACDGTGASNEAGREGQICRGCSGQGWV